MEPEKLANIKLTQHAEERYAERIMNRNDRIEVTTFIAQNKEKIRTDILKMIEFGTLLYSGKPTSDIYNRQAVDIYLNGTWVVILDKSAQKVVTLYSIDLGVGPELNETYINRLEEKLSEAKARKEEVAAATKEEIETYRTMIAENEALVQEYRKNIKNLEALIDSYRDVLQNLQVKTEIADKEVRTVVATFIGKKIF